MYESIVANSLEILAALPTPVPQNGKIAGIVNEFVAAGTAMFEGDNLHFPLGTTYLRLGVRGVAKQAQENAKKAESAAQKELLESIAVVYNAIGDYFARYAQAVLVAANGDERLLHIADNLKALSEREPVHFDEAMQLMYLMWKMRSSGFGGDIGRLDVRMRPYFEKDIADGYLTEEEALDILVNFWNLLYASGSGDTLVNIMLGGRNADGSDAGSRVTVLMLEATKICRSTDPHIAIRLHKNLHPDIYQAVKEVQLMGIGQGTLYNDDMVIPALMRFGVPEELACQYTNDGCCEVMLDGISAIEFLPLDCVATFELAFNNGSWSGCTYRRPSKYWNKNNKPTFVESEAQPGFESGRPEDCETFEEFYQQFLAQYRFQVRNRAARLKRMHESNMTGVASSVLVNGSFESVLESGKDYRSGGLIFEDNMMFSGSIPTAADCLMAVKKVVFEQKLYTVPQIREAILVNYEGYEVMRRQLEAAPKFGKDIDEVDLIAADIANHFCDWLIEYRKETGFAIMPALYGWRFVDEAHSIGATPDGRKYADSIAEHFCATPGKAVNGPTAQILSVAKAKEAIDKACGITVFHITLPRNLGNSDAEGLEVLDGLDQMMVACGLGNMTIGIYDRELLREAQREPEKHKDVIVRVWGYSARFVDLSEEMQEHVISRIPEAS